MRFMKYRWLYYLITFSLVLTSIISLFVLKFNPSIDFLGGSLLEIQIVDNDIIIEEDEVQDDFSKKVLNVNENQVREIISEIYEVNTVQTSGINQFIIKGITIDNNQKQQAIIALSDLGNTRELRFETIGPTMGKELLIKTIIAVLLVAILICLYVWQQFKSLKYGVCSILAMFHDTIILMGAFSLFGYFFGVEVDILFVTALLTTLSFSIHDTVVIYHRIKEVQQKNSRMNLETVADIAITETLNRSINNSMTIIIMLLALVLLGGATIRSFCIALLIGAVIGTYSSTFTAVPLLLLWDDISLSSRTRSGI